MLKSKQIKKGSSSIDYVLLISIVLTALLMLALYVQRGIMYKYKQTGDSIGHGRQYDGDFKLGSDIDVE